MSAHTLTHAAADASQLGARKAGAKSSDSTPSVSCASAWGQTWNVGDWSLLGLSPVDETNVLRQEQSRVLHCAAPLGTLGALQEQPLVVPCAACPQGYEFAETGGLQCRPAPDCSAAQCTTCQIDPMQPFFTGSCAACIDYGCDPFSNRCSCAG